MLFHLWLNEWKRVLKSPALLLFTLFLPIVLLLIVGFVAFSSFQEEFEEVEMIIVDEDETNETNALISQLDGDQTLAEQIQFIDGGNDLEELLENPGEAAAILRIPKGFTEKLRSGENENIFVYLNEAIPFSSQLAQLFLESGQSYITSAQAGVNTVHHFYSQYLEGDERSEMLQQHTIHFTFLALGRNDLFEIQEGLTGDMLGWKDQLMLSGMMLLFFFTYILLASLFRSKEDASIQERLDLINVSKAKQRLARFLFHLSFSFIYLLLMLWAISVTLESYVSVSWPYVVQWFGVALWISGLFFLVDWLIRERAIQWFVYLLAVVVLLLTNGFILPPAYLPDFLKTSWLEPIRSLYTGFASVESHGELPWFEWCVILVGVGIILFLNGWSREKVSRR